jgi:hypothetical protein
MTAVETHQQDSNLLNVKAGAVFSDGLFCVRTTAVGTTMTMMRRDAIVATINFLEELWAARSRKRQGGGESQEKGEREQHLWGVGYWCCARGRCCSRRSNDPLRASGRHCTGLLALCEHDGSRDDDDDDEQEGHGPNDE